MADKEPSASPASTISSQDSSSDKDSRRTCQICKTRISSISYDKHTLCVSCRGVDCTDKDKCNECITWSKEEFAKYLKHRKSLISKAISKSKNKGSKSESSKSYGSSSIIENVQISL